MRTFAQPHNGSAIAASPPIQDVSRSARQPIDRATRAFTEARLAHDFSRVLVHAAEYGEYVNGELMTAPVPEGDPLVPATYNGAVLPTPAVDYNFDITSYRFQTPGRYEIQWRLGTSSLQRLVDRGRAAGTRVDHRLT